MKTLPPNPPACRVLSDTESQHLRSLYPGDWPNPASSCMTCATKRVFLDQHGEETRCDCVAQWLLHRWMLNAGIGTHYQRLCWDDIKTVPEQVIVEVVDYVEQAPARAAAGVGLTLWSKDRGTGKTMLLALLAKSLMVEGIDVYFMTFADMLDASVAGWRDEEQRAWFQRRIRNARALFVDDIGREHKGRNEVAEAMFDAVVRHRVSNSLPTFLSTNLDPDQMLQGYGPNVLSLLSEVNLEVHVPGTDFRSRAREQRQAELKANYVRPLVVA